MPNPPDSNLVAQLSQSLLTKYHLPISPIYLTNFLANTRNPPPPLPALLSTAHFRLLKSDITSSLSTSNPAALLPLDIGDVNVKERRLTGNVPVQVLDIIDTGTSKWSQVEAIERVERGEEIHGREIIRTIAGATDDDDSENAAQNNARSTNGSASATTNTSAAPNTATTKRSQGPHKLIVQDATKTTATVFELVPLPNLFISNSDPAGLYIGCKLILKTGTLVRRGMVMLTPETTILMRGKIESWDRKWREDRKKTLTEQIVGEHEEQRRDGG